MDYLIQKKDALDAMWKALYKYQDDTEKQFQEHEELDLADWFQHRIFVQNIHAECMNAVESLKRIDAVPVVRCKDCRFGDTGTYEDGTIFWKCLGIHYGLTKPDDYCSHGKRKKVQI